MLKLFLPKNIDFIDNRNIIKNQIRNSYYYRGFYQLKILLEYETCYKTPKKTSMQESNSDKDYRKCSNHKLLFLNAFPMKNIE